VRTETYTLPDVRQERQDADRMPMAHPMDVPQPMREPVPSPTAKEMGRVTFKSPVCSSPLVRNSDPRVDGFVEEERAFPDGVVTKTAVIVTGIPPELEAFTSRTHPTHVEPDARPVVTVRLSSLAPWAAPCLAKASWADESEACPANTKYPTPAENMAAKIMRAMKIPEIACRLRPKARALVLGMTFYPFAVTSEVTEFPKYPTTWTE